jgi:TRAP-type mannitol/chloroaromatic compound transport system permease small subunit
MLAASYTLMKGGHIRTDVLYERWSPRRRAIVDAVCYVLFFFPGMLCILWAGAVEARQAWEIGERTGLRIASVAVPMSAVKSVIPVSAALLVLQGVSELMRCVRTIRGGAR